MINMIIEELTFIVVGAGQIGKRHIQSLCFMESKLNIDVIDPSIESLNTVKKLIFDGVDMKLENKSLNYFQSMDNLKIKYDFAIIATTSDIRKECEIKRDFKKECAEQVFKIVYFLF